MAVSVWYFLRPKAGELKPLAFTAVDAFLSAGGRLPVDADGFVRTVEVAVLLEARRAQQILRLGFFQHRAHADGTVDQDHERQVRETLPTAALGGLAPTPEPGVIDANQAFAQRRLEHLNRWTPTTSDHAALCEAVNRKARWKLMGPGG